MEHREQQFKLLDIKYQGVKIQNLKSSMYGPSTGRYTSFIFLNDDQIMCPIGINLVVYDINTFKRVKVLSYNNNAIFVLLQNSKYIFSISFNGQIVVIDKQNLSCLQNLKTQGRDVRFSSVNEQLLVVSCEVYNQKDVGSLETFEIQQQSQQLHNQYEIIKQIDIIEGAYRYSIVAKNNVIITAVENPVQLDQSLKQQQQQKNNYFFTSYDPYKKQILNKVHHPYIGEIIYAEYNENFACYLYQDRRVLIIDILEGKEQPLYFGQIEGKGGILTATLQGDCLYLCPKNGYLLKIYLKKEKEYLPSLITFGDQQQNYGSYELFKLNSQTFSTNNYYLQWNKSNNNDNFVVFNEEGLTNYSYINKKQIANVSHANITCVGLATDPQEKYVSVGDMLGNIYIYLTENNEAGEILNKTWLPSSIRCLAWSPCGCYIFIGTMDGSIYKWNFQEKQESEFIINLKQTITSIKPKVVMNGGIQDVKYLVTNTQGEIFIFQNIHKDQKDYEKCIIQQFIGHHAVDQSKIKDPSRFGSLHIKAEIWNSTWDCNSDNQIGSCSEDQTSHIFNLQDQNQYRILDGQSLAVTSVDWQNMDNRIGTIFVQCSDDRTIQFYNPENNFEQLYKINTQFMFEWFTLTYLALEKGGTRLAIGGQSGYLFIFDLLKKEWVYAEKIHLGGIEGLIWENNKLITCSSDCCINIITLDR